MYLLFHKRPSLTRAGPSLILSDSSDRVVARDRFECSPGVVRARIDGEFKLNCEEFPGTPCVTGV